LEDLLEDEEQTQLVLKLLAQDDNKQSKDWIEIYNEELEA